MKPPVLLTLVAVSIGCGTPDAVRQEPRAVTATSSPATGRRLALVLGNNAYPEGALKNAVNDATAMTSALRRYQFDVDLGTDLTLRQLTERVDRFLSQIKPGDTALVYYAGHGMQIQGENYLIPVDFTASDEADAKYQAYSATRISDRLVDTGARLAMLILDACRNNPFRPARSGARGLAAMESGRGALIAFATGPNQTADDSPRRSNGLFTAYVLEGMEQAGLTVEQVFSWTRKKVHEESGGRQTPWLISSVVGDFYFNPRQAPAAAVPMDNEAAYWTAISERNSPGAFREYLDRYPNGRFAPLAKLFLQGFIAQDSAVAPPTDPRPAPPPAASTAVPEGAAGSVQLYFLKAQDRKTYVPLIAPVPAVLAASRVGTYFRVEHASTRSPAVASTDRSFPFETYQETDLSVLPATERAVQAVFTVPAGDYLLSIASMATDGASAPATIQQLRAMVDRSDAVVTKTPVSVPDFWNDEFTTSSVMVLKSEPKALSKPLTPAELVTRPFSFGGFDVRPTNGRRFARSDELSIYFLIYNTGLSPARKPDVLVDYVFHLRPPAQAERFFNRTERQAFNARTLPPEFDVQAHALTAGQSVPLWPFAPGEYRLEVSVEDRVTGQKVLRSVTFTVY